MATARTHAISGNSTSTESIYRDTEFPWINYVGTRSEHNLKGPRNRWMVIDERTKQKTGPFPTLRLAWSYIHGTTLPAGEQVSYNAVAHTTPNGVKPAESQPYVDTQTTQTPENQPTLFDELEKKEMETADQIIEFACPHCKKAIIGLLARK